MRVCCCDIGVRLCRFFGKERSEGTSLNWGGSPPQAARERLIPAVVQGAAIKSAYFFARPRSVNTFFSDTMKSCTNLV